MDEKMKDAVKITVIATGFREAPSSRHRPVETRTSFASAHEDAMEFPEEHGSHDFIPEPPKHIMEAPTPDDSMSDDRMYVDDTPPAPMSQASDHLAGDVVSLDAMRDNLRGALVSNFEQDDLDVPAFLRKRNEVM
jgi:hypothetical protein